MKNFPCSIGTTVSPPLFTSTHCTGMNVPSRCGYSALQSGQRTCPQPYRCESGQGQVTGPFQYKSIRTEAAAILLPGYHRIYVLFIFFNANTRAYFCIVIMHLFFFSLLLSCVTERTFSHVHTNPFTHWFFF